MTDLWELSPGDVLAHPDGEARVLAYERWTDVVITTRGKFGIEEIEVLDEPDWADQAAVEHWLRLAGRIVPRAPVTATQMRCPDLHSDCFCTLCTTLVHHDRFTGRETAKFHQTDAPACACAQKGCPCAG